MSEPGVTAARRAASEGLRALWTLALVLVGTAALLWALDAVPGWLRGEPRGVRRASTVEEAERQLRARLMLPAYFPDTYRWPPKAIRLTRDEGGSVALAFDARDGTPSLFLAETVGGTGPLGAGLLPEAAVIQQQRAGLGEGSTLSRIVGEDGTLWNQLEWTAGGRHFVLRGRGPLEGLTRMARSIHGVVR
ncbi:MAG TPA: hypothetical protein VMK42_09300 [Anaeromyxobacteraceae bacterium]|nr:hypothetical protein [Anaeromyxobacteraceae bacterium]